MSKSFTLQVLLVLLGNLVSASSVVGPITNPANGHDYYLLEASTWTAAETEAVSLDGHLATINDAAEHDWIYPGFPICRLRCSHLTESLPDLKTELRFW